MPDDEKTTPEPTDPAAPPEEEFNSDSRLKISGNPLRIIDWMLGRKPSDEEETDTK